MTHEELTNLLESHAQPVYQRSTQPIRQVLKGKWISEHIDRNKNHISWFEGDNKAIQLCVYEALHLIFVQPLHLLHQRTSRTERQEFVLRTEDKAKEKGEALKRISADDLDRIPTIVFNLLQWIRPKFESSLINPTHMEYIESTKSMAEMDRVRMLRNNAQGWTVGARWV